MAPGILSLDISWRRAVSLTFQALYTRAKSLFAPPPRYCKVNEDAVAKMNTCQYWNPFGIVRTKSA